MNRILIASFVGALLAIWPGASLMAQEFVLDEAPVERPEDQGWSGRITFSGTFALSDNSKVVGQPDGMSMSIGSNIAGRLSFIENGHNVRNTLRASHTFNRTPTIPSLVKTVDELRIESLYLYHFPEVDWVGPFARAQLNTAVFHGFDVRPEEVDYVLDDELFLRSDRLRLTNAFKPLTLRESLGAFLRPTNQPAARTMLRLGGGARQIFADGQLAVSDDPDTEVIELVELRSYNQVGAEAVAEVTGELRDGRITYAVEAETLIPFYSSLADDDRSAFELANVELSATLAFKLLSWASLDYQFRAARIPALIEDWQVSNNLLLSITWTAGFGDAEQ